MSNYKTTPRDLEYFADVNLIVKENNDNEFLNLICNKYLGRQVIPDYITPMIETTHALRFETQEDIAANSGFIFSKVYRIRFVDRDDFHIFCEVMPKILDNWKFLNIIISTHMMQVKSNKQRDKEFRDRNLKIVK